ncbi:MAG: Translin family protein [Methanosaeta sp. PtaU1.Bin112]|nr:MAG: Translin family protein [Methanosaeta sp. PtaU1.Bin112]
MTIFENLSKSLLDGFDCKDRAREEAYRLSRMVIRLCSSSIRSVHRNDLAQAEKLMSEAANDLERIRVVLSDHQDVRYAGFVDGAEQEYAEARCVYSITTSRQILTPDEVGVETVNYLAGLGDVTGELRRHILDLIRAGRAAEGEYFLSVIEEIYYLLMLFDYPDAITRGLRRKSDLARSMLERTRGDLTNALELAKMQDALCSCREQPEK